MWPSLSRKMSVVSEIFDGRKCRLVAGITSAADALHTTGNTEVDKVFSDLVPSESEQQGAVAPHPTSESNVPSQLPPARAVEVESKRKRQPWTSEEEQRLADGHSQYGSEWERIRESHDLMCKTVAQLRDKWKNAKMSSRA